MRPYDILYTALYTEGKKFSNVSSNSRHYGLKIFKPEKNLEFFRLKF